jgi:hypothetical protein
MAVSFNSKKGLPHGFVSKAQWRYFFANPRLKAKYARKEAHKVIREKGKITGYRSLPKHKNLAGKLLGRGKS